MRAYIASCIIGIFAFDKNGKLIEKLIFPKDADEIAEKLSRIKAGELINEEYDLVKKLSVVGYKEIVWNKQKEVTGMNCIFEKDNLAEEKLQSEFRSYAVKFKWASTQAEINDILTKVNIALNKTKLREIKKDKIIMQSISALDELDRSLNIFSEHLREWYGLHFPELSHLMSSNEKYVEMVTDNGDKKKISDKQLIKTAEKSSGMPFSEEDMKAVQEYSKTIFEMFRLKDELTKYIEKETQENVPNITAIAGPLLAARLLSYAGGLEKMCKMPSSTIQLLGAEKALFRHLRGEGKAPKFGIIFGHPYIQKADKEKKGKIARLLASKLSLAARIDFFSKDDRSAAMKKDFEEHAEKILRSND